MHLNALQRQWDRLGRKDPLWAVLSLPERRGGRWDEAEFFATGEREIAGVVSRARDLHFPLRAERALDFGCGVGRLTQALAQHFARVDGVDIAPSMLVLARRYNRHGERCAYHLNSRDDLSLFPDASFGFVYSSLVLQHIKPATSRRYIRDFVRVLAPGGLLVFHLPSEPYPRASTPGVNRSRFTRPLPWSAMQVSLAALEAPTAAPAGEQVMLRVLATNVSGAPWPCLGARDDRYQIKVANRWLEVDGEVVNDCDARASLPHDVAPGGSVEVYLRVTVPKEPDDYTLELDLVQEGVAWFHQQGRPALALPFLAEGERVPRRARTPRRVRPAPAGLKDRHPRIHRLVQASGLSALRSTLAPAWWRARQAVHWHLNARAQHLAERWRQAADPPMDMQGIPRAEVLDLLALAGARPLDVENAELAHAGWQAYRYWATRD